EIVPLGGVGPECVVLLGGSVSLDVADGESQGVMDALEPGISARVPRGVGDAARGNEANPYAALGLGSHARRKTQREDSIAPLQAHSGSSDAELRYKVTDFPQLRLVYQLLWESGRPSAEA